MDEKAFRNLIRQEDDGLCLPVKVQPRSSRNGIVGLHDGALKISLTSPPVDGKANADLTKFLAKKLHISKSSIEIISGQTGRNKHLAIKGISLNDFINKMVNET
jgi:uncharacterized protein (TIGR00251 family)